MASTYKVLGQARPGGSSEEDLYTNPAGGQAIISTIAIANTNSSDTTYRIHIRKDGQATGVENALAYNVTAPGSTTTTLTLGITIDAADVITVLSDSGGVTFHAFGLEIL